MNRAWVLDRIRRRCGFRFPSLGRRAYDAFSLLGPEHVYTELLPNLFVNLYLPDEVQRATYWQGERFEHPTIPVLTQWVEGGAKRFFDIGSNYGFFSFALITKFPHLRADAFEPNPRTFFHLEEIKTDNQLNRLAIWNVGLSDHRDTLRLRRGISDSGHSTFGDHPQLPVPRAI